jgi:tetratricopeptide (TPR) repeat protein
MQPVCKMPNPPDSKSPAPQRRPLRFIGGAATPADSATLARQALQTGEQLLAQGQFEAAAAQFQRTIDLQPQNVDALIGFATANWRASHLDVVEPTLNRALQLDPNCVAAHEMLSQWHLLKGRPAEALDHITQASALAPNDIGVQISRAFVLADLRDAASAWQIIEPLLDRSEFRERITIVYAQIARVIGRSDEAAAYGLHHLATSPTAPPERRRLLFELAGLLDRLGRYDEAFDLARRARESVNVSYDPAEHSRQVDQVIADFSAERLKTLPRAATLTPRLVFIVGMPRSGTSLVEQILASHPDVHAAGELEDLIHIVSAAKAAGSIDVNAMQADYLKVVDALKPNDKRFIDKNPLNFEHLGWIELLFPGARIIHCTRNPLDTCLSCLMTDIAAGVRFCGSQQILAAYYNDYARLMTHWRSVLGTPMLEVSYETLVTNLESESRRMIEFLDLPWNDQCLSFHANPRGVGSASRDQVRRPIYTSSVGRWKHYERHLGELIQLLDVAE